MLLIGGGDSKSSKQSTEYVTSPQRPDVRTLGLASPLTLQYDAFHACAIQLQEDIVLTGLLDSNGSDEYIKVVKYKTDGSPVKLPDLRDKRIKHGCSSYTEGDNKVSKEWSHFKCFKLYFL